MLSLNTLILLFTYLITTITAAPAPAPANAIPTPATYLILSADVSQPWSGIQGTNPEQWNFTIVGQWPGSKPVTCSLDWNAGSANVTDEARSVVDVTFNNCTDPGVRIDMTRFRVEAWFLWQLTIAATYVYEFFPVCVVVGCACFGNICNGIANGKSGAVGIILRFGG